MKLYVHFYVKREGFFCPGKYVFLLSSFFSNVYTLLKFFLEVEEISIDI